MAAEIKNRPQLTKALAAAGITPVEINGSGRSLEVVLADRRDARRFRKNVANWGGYICGWGGFVLRPGYQSSGDYMDKSSRWHC